MGVSVLNMTPCAVSQCIITKTCTLVMGSRLQRLIKCQRGSDIKNTVVSSFFLNIVVEGQMSKDIHHSNMWWFNELWEGCGK